MATPAAPPTPARPIILPSRGIARVKSVLSGDTVILLGKASAPGEKAPEVVFTLENISAPRYVGKIGLFVSYFLVVMHCYGSASFCNPYPTLKSDGSFSLFVKCL